MADIRLTARKLWQGISKRAQVVDPLAKGPSSAQVTPPLAEAPMTEEQAVAKPEQAAPKPEQAATPSAQPIDQSAYDPSATVSRTMRDYLSAPGSLTRGLEGLQGRLLEDPQLKQHYAQQLGDQATDEQITQQAMQTYFQQQPQTVDELASRQGQLLRLSQSGPYTDQAREALGRLPERLQSVTRDWSPEQWQEYNQKVEESLVGPEARQALTEAGVDLTEQARGAVEEGAEERSFCRRSSRSSKTRTRRVSPTGSRRTGRRLWFQLV